MIRKKNSKQAAIDHVFWGVCKGFMAAYEVDKRKWHGLLVLSILRRQKRYTVRLRWLIIRMSGPHNVQLPLPVPLFFFYSLVVIRNKREKKMGNRMRSRASKFLYRSWNTKKISWIRKKGCEQLCWHYFFECDCSAFFTFSVFLFAFLLPLWYFICLEIHFFVFFLCAPTPYMQHI